MPELEPDAVLAGATVDLAVFALRPDYRVPLLAVAGLPASGPGDDATEALLENAEAAARTALDQYVGSPRLIRAEGTGPFDPVTDEQLAAAGTDLLAHLRGIAPELRVAQRSISAEAP